ncbi:hypothetical protein LPJ75_001146 [Coemansia sp. RSA 2598]|nr:hypothetical protein LPJ75_001146 [Coemansia sp. RSA 2598]
MTVAQPFPVLPSADNSRSASPALSSGSPGAGASSSSAQRNGKGRGGSNFKPTQAAASKPRHKKQQKPASASAAAAAASAEAEAGQGSETNANANANASASTNEQQQQQQQQVHISNNGKHKNKSKKAQPRPKSATVAVANEQQPSGKENVETRPSDAGSGTPKQAGRQKKPRAPTASAGEEASKKQSRSSRRRTVASVETNRGKQSQVSAAGSDATLACAPTASVELQPPVSAPPMRSVSSSVLPMAMIVPGENGRARVLFNPQALDNDHPLASATPSPRFSSSSVQSARGPSSGAQLGSRARFPAHYGDSHGLGLGLGLRSPMSPALPSAPVSGSLSHVTPPIVRHRSLTSTQLRSTARSFSPQSQFNQHQYQNQQYHHSHHQQHQQQQLQHQQQIHQYQPQQQRHQPHTSYYHQQAQQPPMRRLSSASSAGYDGMVPPLSAPAGDSASPRGRSQSVSTHISMTGLRISMAQSRPGNVLAPHLPLLSRAASGGAVQANTYANGGYFATRRASVSNVGLAVDPSHSIRIPTIMFQKPKPEDLAKAASAAASAAAAASASPSPQPSVSETASAGAQSATAVDATSAPAAKHPSSEPSDSLATPVTGGNGSDTLKNGVDEPSAGEALAMQRLQEMISSMRSLTQTQTPKTSSKAQTQTQTQNQSHQAPPQTQKQHVPSNKLADVDVVGTAALQMPPTPAAHPTSRFDSILEEDEDNEADEEILDAETAEDSSVTASSHHDGSDAAGYSSGACALDGPETSSSAAAPALFAA